MSNNHTKKGVIAILTGGGDVPGLNPAIRAITIRAIREGYQVIGVRHGWTGAGGGQYTGPDNPATVTMNQPITETAR